MANEAAGNYLRDLGDLVKRAALDARAQHRAATGEVDRGFESGRLMAYHEVISLMQQQAAAFGIDLRDLALDDIDPERDLL